MLRTPARCLCLAMLCASLLPRPAGAEPPAGADGSSAHEPELDRWMRMFNLRIKCETRLKDIKSEMREKQMKLNLDGTGIPREVIMEIEIASLLEERKALAARVAEAEVGPGNELDASPSATTVREAAARDLRTLDARIETLRSELGALHYAMITYLNLLEERKFLQAQLRPAKEYIENSTAHRRPTTQPR